MADERRIVLGGARLEGLEAILSGVLGPVDGYCLPGDKPTHWPVEAKLRVDVDSASGIQRGATVILSDPDNTPLAEMVVAEAMATGDAIWLSGRLTTRRAAEHGIARDRRISSLTDFSGRVGVLVSPMPAPSDFIRVAQLAMEQSLVLVAVGSRDDTASARLVVELEQAALLLPNATVCYLPAMELETREDVALAAVWQRNPDRVIDLRSAESAGARRGAVVLFTGLSGAGKSTIARAVAERIAETGANHVVLLDGDHVRHELASELGFSRDDRDKNLKRIAWVGARVAEGGGLAICAPIAPFASSRDAMRAKVEPQSPFLMVYVSTPIAVAEQRDRKGLYEKARAGLIKDFTGIDSPYEAPTDADLEIDTSELSLEACVDAVMDLLTVSGALETTVTRGT